MSFGINFKYNGLLHHHIDRVWVVTKVALPKLNNISFPDIAFDPDCPFVSKFKHSRTAAQQVEKIKGICKSMKPLITLMKQKELYCENAITKILKEDILQSLHSSGYSHASSTFQDPASAGLRFSHETNRETPVCMKKALSDFLPAITSLATIAVESLNSFLQRKHNKAMVSGLKANEQDQSLAWNSLKQLENDFLLYGKYNVAQLHDIVRTINGLQNKTMQIEKLLTGQDLYMVQITHMAPDVTGRMTFIQKLNLYVPSVLKCQIRLYEWLW